VAYKREELKVHKDGYSALAAAVMRQWNEDGRPRGDAEGASLWGSIIEAHQQRMRKPTYSLVGVKEKRK
jgi:hypothetical protein